MNWYKYLDPRFALAEEAIRDRDRVVTVCPRCKDTNVVIVTNLKSRIRKYGNYVCRSCSSSDAAIKARSKRESTMLERYGERNPMRVAEFRRKAKETAENRYGPGGSQAVARRAKKGAGSP